MRKFDKTALTYWANLNINQKKRLEVFPFRVVPELFYASRDFNELSLVRL